MSQNDLNLPHSALNGLDVNTKHGRQHAWEALRGFLRHGNSIGNSMGDAESFSGAITGAGGVSPAASSSSAAPSVATRLMKREDVRSLLGVPLTENEADGASPFKYGR